MKENDSITAYFQQIQEARYKLTAESVHIDDEELEYIMLKGLPHQYYSCSAI